MRRALLYLFGLAVYAAREICWALPPVNRLLAGLLWLLPPRWIESLMRLDLKAQMTFHY